MGTYLTGLGASCEVEQLRQRVAELEKQRDDFRRDAAEFSGQVSRLVDHNNNLVNHREELILEITRIKRGDFSNERIENDSLKLCINVQNEQIEKLTAERDELLEVVETAYKVASEHDDRLPFDWAVYCEMLYQTIASVKEK